MIVERFGGPLGLEIEGANIHDTKLLEATIEAIVVERPDSTQVEQHLCLDKGYDNDTGWGEAIDRDYEPHIRQKQDARPAPAKGHPARRWVVERTLAWLSKCRAILVRYDKHSRNYLGLIQLACALLWFRRLDNLR